MIMTLYHGYHAAFWPAMVGFGVFSVVRQHWAVLRCVAVLAVGQGSIEGYQAYLAPDVWQGQPWHVYAAIYAASAAVVTVRPSGKICSIMGGVMIAGLMFAIVRGAFGGDAAVDLLYWQVNVLIGWATLAVVAGGSSGEHGRRFCVDNWGRLTRLAKPSRDRGVA